MFIAALAPISAGATVISRCEQFVAETMGRNWCGADARIHLKSTDDTVIDLRHGRLKSCLNPMGRDIVAECDRAFAIRLHATWDGKVAQIGNMSRARQWAVWVDKVPSPKPQPREVVRIPPKEFATLPPRPNAATEKGANANGSGAGPGPLPLTPAANPSQAPVWIVWAAILGLLFWLWWTYPRWRWIIDPIIDFVWEQLATSFFRPRN